MLIYEDLSSGEEKIPVRVINDYNGKSLDEFEYVTKSTLDLESIGGMVYEGSSNNNIPADITDTLVYNLLAHGIRFRFEVYCKSADFWAVRTLDEIPKGQLIGEYVGNITKGFIDTVHDNYIFSCVDKNGTEWNVDAYRIGNFTRFINHSCCHNIDSFVHGITSVPRIFFYSNRTIEVNEELTINYGDEWWESKPDLKCNCKRLYCRYNDRN